MPDELVSESPRARSPWRRAPAFVAVLCAAVVLELGPWPAAAPALKPDFAAIALVYWGIHAPRLAGFFAAFVAGLLMDFARQTPLGFTPMTYAVVMLGVEWFRGRFALFALFGQGVHVFLILSAGQLAAFLLGLLEGGGTALSWRYFLPSMAGGFLWMALPALMRQLRRRMNE